jgi:hypothetical protein
MLQQFQIDMLAAAAQHKGRIAQILVVAVMHNDVDTVEYIVTHYANTTHFTFEQLEDVKLLKQDIEEYRQNAQHATIH